MAAPALQFVWAGLQGVLVRCREFAAYVGWLLLGRRPPVSASASDIGFTLHRASHSPIRLRLQTSALNPLGPVHLPEKPSEPLRDRLQVLLRLRPNSFASAALGSNTCYLPQQPGDVRRSHKRRKTLVLDLDETLVHASISGGAGCELITEVYLGGHSCLYYVQRRPHLELFLQTVSAWYQLAVFTASVHEYADAVVSWLDNGRKLFLRRLFRTVTPRDPWLIDICVYAKDVSKIERDLSRVILLDNTAAALDLCPDNGILIDTWLGDARDEALVDVIPFLDVLRFLDDVRVVLGRRISAG